MNQLTHPADAELVSFSRRDTDTDCFRELHDRFHPKIYNYTLGQIKNEEEALAVTDAYFVNMAKKITEVVHSEQLVRSQSLNVQEARATKKLIY